MIARGIIVVVVGALLVVQVVRTAIVASPTTRLTVAPRVWPSHPAVLTDRVMEQVGARAREGQSLPPETLREVDEIARRAPLAPEPFLIKGALMQVDRREEPAERLFTAARLRAPRSEAARFFLADRYVRTGRIGPALTEIAVLSRLFPNGRAGFAAPLAQFAKSPGAVPQMRRFFRTSSEMEGLVLSALADDARNADLILALWTREKSGNPAEAAAWQSKLITKLVEQGQYAKAHSVWRSIAGVTGSAGGIFNPGFVRTSDPPPFNWAFANSGGVADPSEGGRLEVIYFGRGDAVLAEQLLLLAPGPYRLSMDVSEGPGEGGEIAWTLTCVPRSEPFFRLPVERKGALAGSFAVPAGCAAQWLRLTGLPGDFPRSQEFTIGKLSLVRGAGK